MAHRLGISIALAALLLTGVAAAGASAATRADKGSVRMNEIQVIKQSDARAVAQGGVLTAPTQ
jgi:hypothetical protein